MATKTALVNKALSYLGSNYMHFCGSFWGGCFAWCAAFVSVCCKEAGVDAPWDTSCTSQRETWRKKGLWHTDRNIQIGDIIYYDWDKSGDCDHVGIVTDVDSNGTLRVTEGNFGDYASSVTKVTNRFIKRDYYAIVGYARPNYDNEPETTIVNKPENKSIFAEIGNGSNGTLAKVLQGMLEINGFSCGEIDGVIGPKTITAIKNYQTKNGLVSDGIVGVNTWGKLKSTTTFETVKNGSKSTSVLVLQAMLDLVGYSPKWIDGEFGDKTNTALKKYQTYKKLVCDGICGPKTWASLMTE